MELELKHLSGYLPYGLKVLSRETIFEMDIYSNMRGEGIEKRDIQSVLSSNMKPILRPLSDLDIHKLRSDKNYPDLEVSQGSIDKLFKIEIGNDLQCFDISIFEYLYENHFDIYGLIEKGLAIDINTLK